MTVPNAPHRHRAERGRATPAQPRLYVVPHLCRLEPGAWHRRMPTRTIGRMPQVPDRTPYESVLRSRDLIRKSRQLIALAARRLAESKQLSATIDKRLGRDSTPDDP